MKTKYLCTLLLIFLTISNFVYSNEDFLVNKNEDNKVFYTDTTILPELPSQIAIDVAPRKIKIDRKSVV